MDAAIQTELSPARVNLRAYLAGTGATGALIGGALIVFLALAAFVAFNGLPLGGQGSGEGSISLAERSISGAPQSAAIAVSGASDAVTATPSGPVPTTVGEAVGGTLLASDPVPGNPDDGPGVIVIPGGPATGDGPLGGVVGGIDNTTGSVGLDLPLGQATDPLTGPLDNTARNGLNNVGNLLGISGLGDRAIKNVNDLTGRLLGQEGVVGNLLQRLRGSG